jgi:hypothetical protein
MKLQGLSFTHFGAVVALSTVPGLAWAASAQVHGQGGVVGEYHTNMPPSSTTYQGFRVPLGFTLEGRASNNLSLFLDLRYSYNRAPYVSNSLGNTSQVEEETRASKGQRTVNGNEVKQPFSLEGGRGERTDFPWVQFAYLQYASDVGLFRAGRIPRHWGLGVWRSAEWKVEGGSLSTSDAVSATFDLTSTFSGSLYLEKNSEGSPTSAQDDADAFTVEALLADDPADVNASGLTRQIGVTFSNYSHKQTDTQLRILDLFAKVSGGGLGGEFEVLYPTGDTKSLDYAASGGRAEKCKGQRNKDNEDITCEGQRLEGLAALARFKWQFAGTGTGPDKSLSLSATESARGRLPTSLRADSHTFSLQTGYSRGDSDAFEGVQERDTTIRTTPLNPNIRPAFLMYNPVALPVPGMPGATMQNTVFFRGDYTYESPSFGSITPSLVWGRLDQANTKAGQLDGAVGRSKNLGVEFDINYGYRTADNVQFGIDTGVWFPGGAWHKNGGKKPSPVYGIRTSASTSF